MNCQSYKNQIDEAAFSDELNRHLEACSDCKTFREERECLRRLLKQLEHVNAPANFEFGVRAKLNSLPASGGNRVWVRRFAFASPALAVAAASVFVFSNYNASAPTNIESAPLAATQTVNSIPAQITPSIASPTPQILVAANSNSSNELFVSKTIVNTANDAGEQSEKRNPAQKRPSQNAVKTNKEPIFSVTSDEPTRSQDEASTKAPLILPDGIPEKPQKKVGAAEALSFFGVDIDETGSVKTVRGKSASLYNIQTGDTIETVNGQKPGEANLDTPLQQITVEVSRGANKRKVTLNIKSN